MRPLQRVLISTLSSLDHGKIMHCGQLTLFEISGSMNGVCLANVLIAAAEAAEVT
jgi:hypothetical protein